MDDDLGELANPGLVQTWDGSSSSLDGLEDGANVVSQLNVLGMFLTLAVCLLTQPFGNLLYGYSRHWVSKLLFLTWRLNPLLCLVEAIRIYVVLLSTAFGLWKNASRGARVNAWQRLQITAAALLLLRAKKLDGDGKLLLRGLYADLGGLGREEGDLDEAMSVPLMDVVAENRAVPVERQGDEVSTSTSTSTTVVDMASDLPAAATLLRRSTTMAEAGMKRNPPQQRDRHAEILKQALGSSALSHSDAKVDILAMVTIVSIAVKLGFMVMPWPIKFAAACMIAGWLAVQVLLLLLHAQEVRELDVGSTVERAWGLRDVIALTSSSSSSEDSPWWNNNSIIIAMSVLVPSWGYLSYLLIAQPDGPKFWASLLALLAFTLLVILPLYTRLYFLGVLPVLLLVGMFVGPWGDLALLFGNCFVYLGLVVIPSGIVSYPMMVPPDDTTAVEVACAVFNCIFTLLAFAMMFVFYVEEGTSQPRWLEVFA